MAAYFKMINFVIEYNILLIKYTEQVMKQQIVLLEM